MSAESPRVIIADDAVLLREGIQRVLVAGGCEVAATAADVPQLDAALAAHPNVDALVLDIRMPPTHTDEGMRALEAIRAGGSRLPVLLLSMYASPALAVRAMAAGRGTGYLLKERVSDGEALVSAIRALMHGGSVVDPEVVAMLVNPRGGSRLLDQLSDREREVLTLMAEGLSNLGIGQRLYLSVKTVETHVAHILDKLGIDSAPSEHRRVLAVLQLLRAAE